MRQSDISRKHHVSPLFVSFLKRKQRHTTNKDLAVEMAKFMGGKPIDFISPKLRETFLAAFPELRISIRKKKSA